MIFAIIDALSIVEGLSCDTNFDTRYDTRSRLPTERQLRLTRLDLVVVSLLSFRTLAYLPLKRLFERQPTRSKRRKHFCLFHKGLELFPRDHTLIGLYKLAWDQFGLHLHLLKVCLGNNPVFFSESCWLSPANRRLLASPLNYLVDVIQDILARLVLRTFFSSTRGRRCLLNLPFVWRLR